MTFQVQQKSNGHRSNGHGTHARDGVNAIELEDEQMQKKDDKILKSLSGWSDGTIQYAPNPKTEARQARANASKPVLPRSIASVSPEAYEGQFENGGFVASSKGRMHAVVRKKRGTSSKPKARFRAIAKLS